MWIEDLKAIIYFFKTKHFFEDFKIEAFMGIEITHIDKNAKKVFTNDNREYNYDRLLIATGSSPWLYIVEGADLDGVCTFHSWDDAENIISLLKNTKKAVIADAARKGQ